MVVVGGGVAGGVVVGGGAAGGMVVGGCDGAVGEVVGGCDGVTGVVGVGVAGAFEPGDLLPLGFPEVGVVGGRDVGDVEVLWGTVDAVSGEDPDGFASTTTDHFPHLSVMFPFT